MTAKEHDWKASVMEKYCSLKSALKSPGHFIDFLDFRLGLRYRKSRSDVSLKLFFRDYFLCVICTSLSFK